MRKLKKIFCLSLTLSMLFSSNVYAQNLENAIEIDTTETISMTKYDLVTGEIEEEVYQENKNLTDSSTFIPSCSTFSIIGDDEREPIDFASYYPYSAIGRLEITFPNGSGYGTGFVVSNDLVLTAGHNVELKRMGGSATKLIFKAGLHIESYIASANATAIYIPTQWKQSEDPNWDWALLRLDKSIGSKTGCINCRVEGNPNGMPCEVTGYAKDWNPKTIQVTGFGRILDSTQYRLFHNADTEKGMSGAPIFIAYAIGDGTASIAVSGIQTQGTGDDEPRNSGVRITTSLLTVLNSKK